MNKRGQETRERIKRNAVVLFAEKGFKQVTMKDICEAAGLSRGGLYGHYESTDQIFQEIMEDMLSRQAENFERKMNRNQSAVTILNDILEVYKSEMTDSGSSLSLAIYEYFSCRDTGCQRNTIYEQYLFSAQAWKKLMRYGMERQEFNEIDIDAVFDLIVFSYQGVRMYSRLMPVEKKIPEGIIREIKKILIRSDSNADNFSEIL